MNPAKIGAGKKAGVVDETDVKLAEGMIDTGHGIRIASGANANIGVEIEETLDGVGAETKLLMSPLLALVQGMWLN